MAKLVLPGLCWLLVICAAAISFTSDVKCQNPEGSGSESKQKLRDEVFKFTNVSIDDIDPGTLLEWLYPGTAAEDPQGQVRTIRVADSVEKNSDLPSEVKLNNNPQNIKDPPDLTSRSDYSPSVSTESYVGPTGPSAQQSSDQYHPNAVEHQPSTQDHGYVQQSGLQGSSDYQPYDSSTPEYQYPESNSVHGPIPSENQTPTYQNYQNLGYSTSQNQEYQPNIYHNFQDQKTNNYHGSPYIYSTPSPQFYANPIPPPPTSVNQPLNYRIPLKQPLKQYHKRPNQKPRLSWFEKQRRQIYDRFREHKKRRRQVIDGAPLATHHPAEPHLPPLIAHHHHLLPVDHSAHHPPPPPPHPHETPDGHTPPHPHPIAAPDGYTPHSPHPTEATEGYIPHYPEGPLPLPPPPSVGPEGPYSGQPVNDEVLQSLLNDPTINSELESLYGEIASLDSEQGRNQLNSSTSNTNSTSGAGNFIANLLGLTSNPSTGSSMLETMMMPVMFMTLSMFTMDIFGRLFPMGNPFDRMDSRRRRMTTTTTTVKPKVTRIQIAPPPIPIISDLIELKTAKIKAAQKEIEDKYERRKNKYQHGWDDSSEESPWWRLRTSSKSRRNRSGLKKRKKKSKKAPKWSLERLQQLYSEHSEQKAKEEQLRILMGVQ